MKKGIIFALITALLFVTHEPVSKLIANDVNPYAITFWRFFISCVILMPMAIVKMRKEKIKLTLPDLGKVTLLSILFICISMITLQVAIKQADSPSLIAILFSSNSVFTIVFARIINKEKLNRNKLIAVILGVIGVILCVDFTTGTNLTSVALALVAALSFSLYTTLGRKFATKLPSSVQSGFVFLIGSVILLVALLILGIDLSAPVNVRSISILAYLGVLVTGVGYASYFRAIDCGGAIMGSFAFFIKPVLTPFATWIINGIVPDLKVFVAVLFIVGASYFAVYRKK